MLANLARVRYLDIYDSTINKAVEILTNANRPLMYGWCSTVCEAHKKGVLLAEEVGAIIDSTATVCHGPSIIGVHLLIIQKLYPC